MLFERERVSMLSRFTYRSTFYACSSAFVVGAVINNLPSLFFVIFQDWFGVSYAQISLLVTVHFLTQLIVDAICAGFIHQLRWRTCICVSCFFSFAGLLLLGIIPQITHTYLFLFIPIITFAIGSGLADVIVNPIIENIPGDDQAGKMSMAHSFYSWGLVVVIILTTITLRIVGHARWYWIPIAWSLLPFANFGLFLVIPICEIKEKQGIIPYKKIVSSRMFILALILMLCAGACEMTVSQWSSLFAEKALGMPKVVGDIAGPCLFACAMGCGRVIFGVLGKRMQMVNVLLSCSFLCIFAYSLMALSPRTGASLFGCMLCGFAVSVLWPGMLSLAAFRFPGGGATMFAFLAFSGDIGCSMGPGLAGIVSDKLVARGWSASSSLRGGLLTCILFSFLMIGSLCIWKNKK